MSTRSAVQQGTFDIPHYCQMWLCQDVLCSGARVQSDHRARITHLKIFACKKGILDINALMKPYKGSGNEREIFFVMLDKSTYLKKLAKFSSQSIFVMYNIHWSNGILLFTELKSVSMQMYKMFSWIFIFGHNAKVLSHFRCQSPFTFWIWKSVKDTVYVLHGFRAESYVHV